MMVQLELLQHMVLLYLVTALIVVHSVLELVERRQVLYILRGQMLIVGLIVALYLSMLVECLLGLCYTLLVMDYFLWDICW